MEVQRVQNEGYLPESVFDLCKSLMNNNMTFLHVNFTTFGVCYPFLQIFSLALTHVYALMDREPRGCCCEADAEPQICILTSFGKQMERHGG